MASVRDEPLSKEEQEEEEMRNELSNAGCFEENMNIEEMRELMKAVNESRKICQKNVETTLTSSPLNESRSLQNNFEKIQETEQHIPSFSYRNAVVSGNLTNDSNVPSLKKNLRNNEKSPVCGSSTSFKNNSNSQPNNSDDELIYDKGLSSSSNIGSTNKSKSNLMNNSPEVPKLQPQDKSKQIQAMMKKLNLGKWRSSILQLTDDENPIISRELIPMQIQNLNLKDIESENFDERIREMSAKLDQLHKQYAIAESLSDIQWGSPIKVATKWNGSLEKKPFVEKSVNNISNPGPSVTTRGAHERATKRKALSNIAAAVRDDSSYDYSDDDDEFVDTKKRKFQQAKKMDEVKKGQETPKNKNDNSKPKIDHDIDQLNLDTMENSNLHNLRKSAKTDAIQSPKITIDQPQYPIKITPPNPAKKSYKGPRAKKKVSIQSDNNSLNKPSDISDEEINKTLKTIDEQIDDNDCVEITDEVGSSPIPKHAQKKIQIAQTHLKNIKDIEERQLKNREEAKKRQEMEEVQKKNILIKKRFDIMIEEKRKNEEKEKQSQHKKEVYDMVLSSNKERVTRSNFNKIIKKSYEEIDEDVLLQDDDDDEPKITHSTIVPKKCPICQNSFPKDQIEAHASECHAFNSDEFINNQPSTSYSSYFECKICNNFRTLDGITFEEHSVKCKEKADDRRTGIYV